MGRDRHETGPAVAEDGHAVSRRHGLYFASAIAATGLLIELGWWVLDPKGDARRHLIDRGVRLLDSLRL